MTSFKIHQDDALSKLKEMDTNSVDMLITSPPYYKKRAASTSNSAELGNEDNQWEYIDHLVDIFKEAKRVVKDSIWVNIGDGANSSKKGNTNGQKAHKSSVSVSEDLRQAQASLRKIAQKDHPLRSLSCLPELFVVRMVYELQLCLRAKIVWHKPNAFGEGKAADRRFNHSYEMLYWFTKHNSPNYYFQEQWEFCQTKVNHLNHIRRGKGVKSRSAFGGTKYPGKQGISHVYSGKSWNPDEHLDEATGMPLRRMRDVWSINTKGYHLNKEHFSAYPIALCKVPIIACCPPGGVVLDIFAGLATTGVTALLLGRSFVGVEISPKFVKLAEHRLQHYKLEAKELRGDVPKPIAKFSTQSNNTTLYLDGQITLHNFSLHT